MKYVDTQEKALVLCVGTFLFNYLVIVFTKNLAYTYANWANLQQELFYLIRGGYSFSCGVLLYYLNQNRDTSYVINKKTGISLLMIVLILLYMSTDYIRYDQFTLLYTVLLYFNIRDTSLFVDNIILSTIGRYCYEIYIVHVTLFSILPSLIPAGRKQFTVMLVLTVVVSFLLHHLVTINVSKFVQSIFVDDKG